MATKLNKKQHELLNAMSHSTLVSIINDLINDNKQGNSILVNRYLLAPDDVLKNIEKEYNKRAKSTRFYDYYETDNFLEDLRINVANLFERTVSTLPEKSEAVVVKMMLDMERLSETKDTSSGGWMEYYDTLVRTWMKSLSEQKSSDAMFIANKIINVYEKEHYFGLEIFNEYKLLLGIEVLRSLRDLFDKKKQEREALALSFIIKDVNYFSQVMKKGSFSDPRHYLDYASLLIEEVRSDKAIEVLETANAQAIERFGYFFKWKMLLIHALIEEGRKKEAKRVCIESFEHSPHADFYSAYIKIEGESPDAANLFMEIAKKRETEYYIQFLNEISRFDLIDSFIANSSKEALAHFSQIFREPFIRSLSSALYKQGYALSATVLRRCLVEFALQFAQSKYYSHAVSDLKKSIDYSMDIESQTVMPDTEIYLSSLYEKHKRKTSLWPLMKEKIKGLSIGKEGVRYERIQS